MELNNALTCWILWVDDEIWGHTSTLDDAKWFLTKISSEIRNRLEKDHPGWTIDCVNVGEDLVKVKCLQPGYMYNSRWTAHSVRYEATFKLLRDKDSLTMAGKRSPSFDTIQNEERCSKPATRPPTPRPDIPTPPPLPNFIPTPPPMPAEKPSRRRRNQKRRMRKYYKQNRFATDVQYDY